VTNGCELWISRSGSPKAVLAAQHHSATTATHYLPDCCHCVFPLNTLATMPGDFYSGLLPQPFTLLWSRRLHLLALKPAEACCAGVRVRLKAGRRLSSRSSGGDK